MSLYLIPTLISLSIPRPHCPNTLLTFKCSEKGNCKGNCKRNGNPNLTPTVNHHLTPTAVGT